MDKKDIKKQIITVTKIYLILVIFTIPFNIFVSFLSSIFNNTSELPKVIFSNLINEIMAVIFLFILIYAIFGIIYLFSIIKRKSDIIKSNSYTRELPEYFPPAIASLLLDLSIETTTDYTATIAYLISKKYIKLTQNGENIEVITDNQLFKSKHEKYVFDCITKKETFNPTYFRKLVVDDAKKMELVEEGKRKIHFIRNFLLILGIYFIIGILHEFIQIDVLKSILGVFMIVPGICIFAIIGYSIYASAKYQNEGIYRTNKGKIEAKKWTGLKKYLNNYTLISDKSLNDIIILEDYIPYAIALNEAKSIEKFIENNESYRMLIYGNKSY